MCDYNVGLMNLKKKKKTLLIKSPSKDIQSAYLVDFAQGNDLKAFETKENITSLFSCYKFNTSNLPFPVTDLIRGTIQTWRFR